MTIFYVYIHRKKSDNSIFYVGKGKDGRITSTSGRSKHWKNIVKKHGYIAEIVYETKSETDAYDREKELIIELKSKGYKLCNVAEGGIGGLSGKKLSAEHREKLSVAKKGKKQSPEQAYKSSIAKLGKKQPRSAVEKTIGLKMKKVISSNGEVFKSASDAARYMSSIFGIKASQGNISICARGERNQAYDRTWSYDVSKIPTLKSIRTAEKKITNGIKVFDSVTIAVKWVMETQNRIANHQSISGCARGITKTAYGYKWTYI